MIFQAVAIGLAVIGLLFLLVLSDLTISFGFKVVRYVRVQRELSNLEERTRLRKVMGR